MSPIGTKLTYEDYLRIPEDGKRHEIIDGEEYVSAAPYTRHQIVVGRLHAALFFRAKASGAGSVFVAPIDVLLSPHDVVEPDVLFISAARVEIITDKNILGPPDLAVEVISESSKRIDTSLKLRRYELYGVSEYWLVDPFASELRVYRLEQARYQLYGTLSAKDSLRSPLLPGFELQLQELFQ